MTTPTSLDDVRAFTKEIFAELARHRVEIEKRRLVGRLLAAHVEKEGDTHEIAADHFRDIANHVWKDYPL